MTLFDRDALLASIDQSLASLRAVLVALQDSEQTEEAREELTRRAAGELSNLPDAPGDWPDVPGEVLDGIRQAKQSARDGDVDETHRHLIRARETLGGRSI